MKRAVKLAIIDAIFNNEHDAYVAAQHANNGEIDEHEFAYCLRDLRFLLISNIGCDPPTSEEIAEAHRQDEEDRRVREAWNKWEDETGPLNRAIPSIKYTPDEIAFEGKCILFDTDDGTWGTGHTYVCVNLEKPTWGKVMRAFDVAIAVTGDTHHCFLEGLEKVTENKDVTVFRFATGS